VENHIFFSIVIPTYNRAHLILRAIDSVIAQTYENWELIIVDDGSTDNTKQIISLYLEKYSHIRYIYQENSERSAARNKGIQNAVGEYICFLDSDDYYLPERLERFHNYLKNKQFPKALVFTGIHIQNQQVEVILNKMFDSNIFDYLTSIIIATPQLCISSDILKYYKFNTRFRFSEDLELCFRIASEFPIFPQFENCTVVQFQHNDRTVGYIKNNTSAEQLLTWRHILAKNHSGGRISNNMKRWILSHLYFNEAKFYMYNNFKGKAIYKIIQSILTNPLEKLNKHRIYCLINLFFNRIPEEYRITNK
jgi:glycosyltransferase involved in cell wall biosynthesis